MIARGFDEVESVPFALRWHDDPSNIDTEIPRSKTVLLDVAEADYMDWLHRGLDYQGPRELAPTTLGTGQGALYFLSPGESDRRAVIGNQLTTPYDYEHEFKNRGRGEVVVRILHGSNGRSTSARLRVWFKPDTGGMAPVVKMKWPHQEMSPP